MATFYQFFVRRSLATAIDLIIQEAFHLHVLDDVTITQVHNILIADLDHLHILDGITITQIHWLMTSELNHLNILDSITISQIHSILIDEAHHLHILDGISLLGSTEHAAMSGQIHVLPSMFGYTISFANIDPQSVSLPNMTGIMQYGY